MPNIKVKGPDGEVLTFEGVERILMDSADGETTVPFSYGDTVENIPIALNLAEGNQQVVAEDGVLVKSAIILKPEDLASENIRYGRHIAGFDGTFIGDTEEVTVDLSMADGDQVIVPSSYGKVLSKVTVKKPEGLVPENIAKGIEIGGVVGEHSGGGVELEGEILKYIAYQLDEDNKELIVCAIFFELFYQDTGSYAIHIPEKIGGYGVVINSEGVT